MTTAGTAPTSAAATPDSKAPSSFDALMKTISTAFTLPRSASGVASAVIIERMFMLIMSAKPLTASATIESGNELESPKTITRALNLMTVAKAIERVADHATNIAEEAFYLYKAQDIRHEPSLKQPKPGGNPT